MAVFIYKVNDPSSSIADSPRQPREPFDHI